jgi:hypothetical protein
MRVKTRGSFWANAVNFLQSDGIYLKKIIANKTRARNTNKQNNNDAKTAGITRRCSRRLGLFSTTTICVQLHLVTCAIESKTVKALKIFG